jgi:DNA polymerase
VVKPEIVVCLGATAAQALLGRSFRVTKQRGEFLDVDFAPLATATIHPSAILRMDDPEERRAEMSAFVADLQRVATRLADP